MSFSSSDTNSKCSFIDKLRGPRIFNLSIFDWVLSLSIAFIVGRYLLKLHSVFEWILLIIAWVLFGIAAHVITKTPTMISYYLGLSDKPPIKKC